MPAYTQCMQPPRSGSFLHLLVLFSDCALFWDDTPALRVCFRPWQSLSRRSMRHLWLSNVELRQYLQSLWLRRLHCPRVQGGSSFGGMRSFPGGGATLSLLQVFMVEVDCDRRLGVAGCWEGSCSGDWSDPLHYAKKKKKSWQVAEGGCRSEEREILSKMGIWRDCVGGRCVGQWSPRGAPERPCGWRSSCNKTPEPWAQASNLMFSLISRKWDKPTGASLRWV